MTIKNLLVVIFALVVTASSAHSVLNQPVPDKFINDYVGLFTKYEVAELEQFVWLHNKSTSNQIAVVTVKSLEGYAAGDIAYQIAQYWGVGQKNKDNGILILIKPKYSREKGEVYISVGYGLESAVPDARAKRIVDRILIPNFKKNKFYKGTKLAVEQLIMLTKGEYTKDDFFELDYRLSNNLLIILLLTVLLIPIVYITYVKHRKIPDEFDHFYVHGEYNYVNIIKQVECIEQVNKKSYWKFQKQIKKYNYVSRNNIIKYADRIDRNMFCYLLNGEKRKKMFWRTSDTFLKIILAYMILLCVAGSLVMWHLSNWVMFFVGLLISYFIIRGLFSILMSLIEIVQHLFRKHGKYTGGVTLSLFALYSIFKRNVKRKYNSATHSYTYYPVVALSSSSSMGGGSFGGSFGGGGFGGGGFGGGGAGGSW